MTDFTPAPWPESISKYFTKFLAHLFPIKEVPEFLHPAIEEYTQALAAMEPEFLFEDIKITRSGTVSVALENPNLYSQKFRDAFEAMEHTLTSIYVNTSERPNMSERTKALWDSLLKGSSKHDESVQITSSDVNLQTAARIAELSDPKNRN